MPTTSQLTLISRNALAWVLDPTTKPSSKLANRFSVEARLRSRGITMPAFEGPAEALILVLAFLASRGTDLIGDECRTLASALTSTLATKVVVLGEHGRNSGLRDLKNRRFQDDELDAFSREEWFADLELNAAELRAGIRFFTITLSVLADGEVAVLRIVEPP